MMSRIARRPLRFALFALLLAGYGLQAGCEHKTVIDRDGPDFRHDHRY